MSEKWKTIKVDPETYREAKEQKEELGRTWNQQLLVEPNNQVKFEIDKEMIEEKIEEEISDIDVSVNIDDGLVEELSERLNIEDNGLDILDIKEAVRDAIRDELSNKV